MENITRALKILGAEYGSNFYSEFYTLKRVKDRICAPYRGLANDAFLEMECREFLREKELRLDMGQPIEIKGTHRVVTIPKSHLEEIRLHEGDSMLACLLAAVIEVGEKPC